MVIYISVQFNNDGFLPDIISILLLTQGYHHWGPG